MCFKKNKCMDQLCTIAYPVNPTDDEQRNMLDFLYGLMNVLPCSLVDVVSHQKPCWEKW